MLGRSMKCQDRGLEIETQVCEAIKVGVGTRGALGGIGKEINIQLPASYESPTINVQEVGETYNSTTHAIVNNHLKPFIFKVSQLFSLPLLLFSLHLPSLYNIYPKSL